MSELEALTVAMAEMLKVTLFNAVIQVNSHSRLNQTLVLFTNVSV